MRGGYSDYVTFNDSAMQNVPFLLKDVVELPEFGFVGDETREKAKAAENTVHGWESLLQGWLALGEQWFTAFPGRTNPTAIIKATRDALNKEEKDAER